MGLLQDGKWVDQKFDTKKTQGRFVRELPKFRNWITYDGSAGPTGVSGFNAEAGRYHLYISHACPWAHRTMLFRGLKGLEDMISVSVVHWYMAENGWTFQQEDGATGDDVNGAEFLHQVYTAALPKYTGRVTVPVLWDKKLKTIVSNESPEIIRMFNSAFDGIGAKEGDYYPEPLRQEIDDLNERIYDTVNNGVYKSGFAASQEAYEEAVTPLFEVLDWLEDKLNKQRFLTGSMTTEADWRLFTTLVRFDAAYVGLFKCNIRRIVDYSNLSHYVRDLYQHPGVAETVNMDHITKHYYVSLKMINPTGIVPVGPEMNFSQPHDRAKFN